ncbi:MAG: dethiobiotin synthase, partial [Candidatus Omnitrophica bacterium]|nr:dethiobiotin synthase [Candidatus Omnitrophota bacterium]
MKRKGIFVTATDTGAGKTYASLVLGHLLKDKKIDVGYMKPVQCSGDDASKITNALDLKDDFNLINPYYFEEPLSPNTAAKRAGRKIDPQKIIKAYQKLSAQHEMMIVEGAGGLLVPLCKDYLIADLIKDLELEVIIVSRLGLGTINHTLLSINQAKSLGINVKGVLFCNTSKNKGGIPEQTNPSVIKDYSGVDILGQVPFLDKVDQQAIVDKCSNAININKIFNLSDKAITNKLVEMDKRYVW